MYAYTTIVFFYYTATIITTKKKIASLEFGLLVSRLPSYASALPVKNTFAIKKIGIKD